MGIDNTLLLHEEIMLLALRDEEGTVVSGTMYQYAIGGAILADLLKTVFDKKKLKGRKERIEQIINGELTGKAAKDAIVAMQAAVMVACIMPAIITTTVSH